MIYGFGSRGCALASQRSFANASDHVCIGLPRIHRPSREPLKAGRRCTSEQHWRVLVRCWKVGILDCSAWRLGSCLAAFLSSQVGVKKIETLASGYRKFVPTKQLTNFNLNLQQQQRFNFYQRYTIRNFSKSPSFCPPVRLFSSRFEVSGQPAEQSDVCGFFVRVLVANPF